MQDSKAKAEGFRVRAAEMRALAQESKHSETRDGLIKIADDYDRLAASLDLIGASKDVLSGV